MSAITGGVRRLLDHTADQDVHEIRSVSYRDDRLIFLHQRGHEPFEGLEMDDDHVLESFSQKDAIAFVREFRLAKAQTATRYCIPARTAGP